MGESCGKCGSGDELLFTCRYCEQQFCVDHQFPHHACERFSRAGAGDAPTDASEGTGAAGTGSDGEVWAGATWGATGGSEPADGAAVDDTREGSDGAGSREEGTRETDLPNEGAPAATESAAPTATADGPGVRSAPETGDETPPMRPMDSTRAVGVVDTPTEPATLGDWLRRQTYLTLAVKVGTIAFLVNAAFYGGVALTLYDILQVGL